MLDKNIENILTLYFEKEIPKQDFSNARLVRNIFEKSKFIQASRVINNEKENKDLIIQSDVESAIDLIDIKQELKRPIGFSV